MHRIIKTLALVIVATLPVLGKAQPPDTLASYTWDYPNESESVTCIRPTQDGGLILSGGTNFGPAPNGPSAWIMKTDSEGTEIWSRLDSGGIGDYSDYIEQTSDGGFIECGETWSYSPYNDWDAYVRKLDADGNQVWARLLGADNTLDYALCVREVPAGGYVTFAEIGDEMTVVRLGPHGGVWWQRSFPSEFTDEANFIEPTQDGGFLLACSYYNDAFMVVKLSQSGVIEWYNTYDEPYGTVAECVRELPDGTIVASGSGFYPAWELRQWYVFRLTAQGEVMWEHIPTGLYSQSAEEIWLTSDGNFVVGGWSQGSEPDWIMEYWLKKYDLEGNVLWELAVPGGDARSVCQMRDGSYAFGGNHRPDIGSDSDAFHVIKTHPEVEISLVPQTTVVPPGGGTITYSASLSNILVDPTPLTAWASVISPAGALVPMQQLPVTFQPGGSFDVPALNLNVPAWAPPGDYTYEIHIGAEYGDPMTNMGLGAFEFTKEGGVGRSDSGALNSAAGDQATLTYELDTPGDFTAWPMAEDALSSLFNGSASNPYATASITTESEANPGHPDEFTLSAYPNPFNAATTVSVTLPESAELTAVVYNVQGRVVARLADAESISAGRHTFTLDASYLASGMYLIRAMVPGQLDQVQKVMLVR